MTNTVLLLAVVGLCVVPAGMVEGQSARGNRIVFDQAHGQVPPPEQLGAAAKKLGLEVQTSAAPITANVLEDARILFLRAPSGEFTAAEAEAIVAFVKRGGSLFVVLDEERRQSLEKTRVNSFTQPIWPEADARHRVPSQQWSDRQGRPRSTRRIERFHSAAAGRSRAERRSPFSWTKTANFPNRSAPTSVSVMEDELSCLEKAWRRCFWATPMACGSLAASIT